MCLVLDQMVDDFSHNEFVEEDDEDDAAIDERSNPMNSCPFVLLTTFLLFPLHILNYGGLSPLYEIEDSCCSTKYNHKDDPRDYPTLYCS